MPLVIGQFLEMVDANSGIVGSTTGSNYYVRILSTLNRELLRPSASVALHRHSNALVDILPPEADSSISLLGDHERPDVTYADIGGYDMQKQEIREAVELPLVQADLYRQIGIDPPRGVLLYGEYRALGWARASSCTATAQHCSSPAPRLQTCRAVAATQARPARARPCWPRRWRTTPPPPSSAWWAPSSYRSTWARCGA